MIVHVRMLPLTYAVILQYMIPMVVWDVGSVDMKHVEFVALESIQTAPNRRQLQYLTQLDRKRFANVEVHSMMKLALIQMPIRLAVIPVAFKIVDLHFL